MNDRPFAGPADGAPRSGGPVDAAMMAAQIAVAQMFAGRADSLGQRPALHQAAIGGGEGFDHDALRLVRPRGWAPPFVLAHYGKN
jgi:hypothetical protein